MAISKDEFRRILSGFATGVVVVTVAKEGKRVHGMAANAFTSVSLDPCLILVCIDRRARTHPLVLTKKRFGISVLSEEQRSLSEFYADARQDHESVEHLGARYRHTERGTPLLEPSLAQLECELDSTVEAGDHTIFIARVEHGRINEGRPLLFYSGKYQKLEPDEN